MRHAPGVTIDGNFPLQTGEGSGAIDLGERPENEPPNQRSTGNDEDGE
jgi:hypothetical protein